MLGDRGELVVLSSLPFAVGTVLTALYGMEATTYALTGTGILVVSVVLVVSERVGTQGRREDADRQASGQVAALREQYVRGELSEAEFEDRVEEVLADGRDDAVDDDSVDATRDRERR